jgi:O-antigen ligase
MVAGLMFSASRGALAATAIAFLLIGGAGMLARGRRSREGRVLPLAFVLAATAVAWLGMESLNSKLTESGLTSDREIVRHATYPMIVDRPWFGSGAGTFRFLFPLYKDARLARAYYDHPHNEPLELLAEQGVVGFALLAGGLGVAWFRNLAAFARRRQPLMRGVLFGSLMGTGALLLHGLVDFNLHIPANAAYFSVLLGLGVVACRLR